MPSSVIDDSELGKFHQQLLGAGIAEYDGSLQVLPHSLQFDDLADTETLVLDGASLTEASIRWHRGGSRYRGGKVAFLGSRLLFAIS